MSSAMVVKSNKAAIVLEGHTAEDTALAMIEGKQKEPFHTFDMDEACKRIQYFKEKMPRVQIFYAMKCNDWELMLKLCVSQGVGFDCATPGEIKKVMDLGVPPSSIIYAMPAKTQEQMIFASEAGVKHTTFDSSYELKKFKQYWPDAKLLLRIKVDSDSVYKLGEKFGCDYDTEGIDLLEEAALLDLNVVGVAFHVGSGCYSKDSHSIGLQRVRYLFDHEAQAGRQMNIIDIGGGFMGNTIDSIDEVSQLINEALETYFPDPSIQVIAEPGRYLVESSATLYSSILNIRRIKKDDTFVNMIYANDGFHGTLSSLEPWHTVERLKRDHKHLEIENEESSEETIIWGPTCDSIDRLFTNKCIRLPPCSPFDWLVFRNQGAYTFVFHEEFCCIKMPSTRAVVSKDLWNQIKDCPVFSPDDFVLNLDISTPLPNSLPPVPPKCFHAIYNTPTLL